MTTTATETNATEFLSTLLGQDSRPLSSCGYLINKEHILSQRDIFLPRCKGTVCYVVSIVLINQNGQVCLVEEAKKECEGKWYLPAGRMEPNETLIEAAKRECQEEAGYLIEPLSLCMIEMDSFSLWLRFTFVAKIVGGSLKTVADKESLRADWFDLDQLYSAGFPRRSKDMIDSVRIAHEYYKHYHIDSYTTLDRSEIMSQRQVNLPSISLIPHKHMFFSYLVVNQDMTHCLLYKRRGSNGGGDEYRIPTILVDPRLYRSRIHIFNNLASEVLFPSLINFDNRPEFFWRSHSTLRLEHNGKSGGDGDDPSPPQDGFHMLFLIVITNESTHRLRSFNPLSLKPNNHVKWVQLDSNNAAISRLQTDYNQFLQFTNIKLNG